MKNAKELAHRLDEVLLNGHWIANTNHKKLLLAVSYKQATKKIGPLNSIALLTFHCNYYIAGVLEVLHGGPLRITDEYSFNMPPMTSALAWEKLRKEFFTNAERLIAMVQQLSNEKLSDIFVKEEYGNYQRNIDGIIEHCYYHLGQMVLLHKLQTVTN